MTEAEAIRFAKTEWWKRLPSEDAARIQLRERKIIMPIDLFKEGCRILLGRPVFTHELGDPGALLREASALTPERSLSDIFKLLPEGRRMLVVMEVDPDAAGT